MTICLLGDYFDLFYHGVNIFTFSEFSFFSVGSYLTGNECSVKYRFSLYSIVIAALLCKVPPAKSLIYEALSLFCIVSCLLDSCIIETSRLGLSELCGNLYANLY